MPRTLPPAILAPMDARELLLEQTRHHHAALTSATDVTPDQARWPGAGPDPSIAALLAHLLRDTRDSARALCELDVPALDVPAPWDPGAGGWPALRAAWSDVSRRFLTGLEQLTPPDLTRAPAIELLPAFEESLATRARFWSGHVFHVAYHLGQIGRLRARQGLGWWS